MTNAVTRVEIYIYCDYIRRETKLMRNKFVYLYYYILFCFVFIFFYEIHYSYMCTLQRVYYYYSLCVFQNDPNHKKNSNKSRECLSFIGYNTFKLLKPFTTSEKIYDFPACFCDTFGFIMSYVST